MRPTSLATSLATSLTAGVSASYAYNALHQRVRKTVDAVTILFAYDDAGNLAGEYSASGAPLQEHVYLGSLPVGVVAASQTYAVHADYLGTPRAVSSGSTIDMKTAIITLFAILAPSFAIILNHAFQWEDQQTKHSLALILNKIDFQKINPYPQRLIRGLMPIKIAMKLSSLTLRKIKNMPH